MKQCPECLAEYEDSINFCERDGKSLVAKALPQARLCPHCANSIDESATKCPYCKADLSAGKSPEWPAREKGTTPSTRPPRERRFLKTAIFVFALALVVFAVGAVFVGRSLFLPTPDDAHFRLLLAEKDRQIEEKEQRLEEKERQIQELDQRVAELRKELEESSRQITQLRNELEENSRTLSAAQRKLNDTLRDVERPAVSPPPPSAKTLPRPTEPPPSAIVRRNAEPGVYEALRPTAVYEEPSGSSRIVSKISRGTKVTVVRSVGEWLEVRSKHGNPPGFIRWDDAMFIGRAD